MKVIMLRAPIGRILRFAIGGCVLSIATAWVFQIWFGTEWTHTSIGSVTVGEVHWTLQRESNAVATLVTMKSDLDAGAAAKTLVAMQRLKPSTESATGGAEPLYPHWLPSRYLATGVGPSGDGLQWITAVGWPLPNLYGVDRRQRDVTTRLPAVKMLNVGPLELPIGVLWRGMAVNSAVLGTLSWLVWWTLRSTARTLIKRRRRKQGRCGNCGYPEPRGATECPECGAVMAGLRPSPVGGEPPG